MTTNVFCLTLLLIVINVTTIQGNSEVHEISNVNERDLSQLLKLLQGQAAFDAGKQGLGKHQHNDRDLNIHTLNQFLKRNGVEDDDINQEISDRICKKTGRCGCSKGRCGKTRTGEFVEQKDNIDELIRELEKLLQRSEIEALTRCGDGHCGRDRDEHHDGVKSKPVADLKQQLERYGKKYRINDDLDAIILDIDDVLKPANVPEKRFDSSMKFNLNSLMDKKQDDLKSLDLKDGLEGVILDLGANKASLFEKRSNKNVENLLDMNRLLGYAPPKKTVPVSPEDLVEYYQVYKHDLTKKLLKYLKDPSVDRQNVVVLFNKQESLLDKLKLKVLGGDKFNDKQLEKLITQIVFGDHSQAKVLAHGEGNDNVYVPRWLYEAVVESVSQKYLRANKRLLPLTQQQKLKMLKKNQRTIWRRNSGPNVQQFGIPFDLNLHALGQAVP
ncbi:hypothetical protein K1T71_012821 [Dendrolimus kikuchii]|uniref:Uncharacterized protein n=1 Tax=Dendrolimus kikuchii TaxID=765133 RepID=A0ACC1CI73_9NEOP|nr:hypothetical protein K1T71_012821 [Dendrolimus kikuchii]